MSEHNKNLSVIRRQDKPAEIMRKWWPNTITRTSQLASSSTAKFEPGGTLIVTHSRSTAHTCMAGEDEQKLGRWNYISLRGKHETYTTIISIYRPAKQQETYARQTAYSAKRRKFLQIDVSPDMLWYSDLKSLMLEKISQGHELIVAGDFKEDLCNKRSKKTKRKISFFSKRKIVNKTHTKYT